MKLAEKAIDPRNVARTAQIELRKARRLLQAIEFCYPPRDGLRDARREPGSWTGPARCPVCFAEWTIDRKHATNCRLGELVHIG